MNPLRDGKSEPRRWKLTHEATGKPHPGFWAGVEGPDLARGVPVEVMPVSEHEEIVASLNVAEPGCAYFVSPAMKRLADEHERLREAAQAVVADLAGEMNLCAQDHPAGEMCGTCQSVLLPAYETLRAALAPAQDNNQEGS